MLEALKRSRRRRLPGMECQFHGPSGYLSVEGDLLAARSRSRAQADSGRARSLPARAPLHAWTRAEISRPARLADRGHRLRAESSLEQTRVPGLVIVVPCSRSSQSISRIACNGRPMPSAARRTQRSRATNGSSRRSLRLGAISPPAMSFPNAWSSPCSRRTRLAGGRPQPERVARRADTPLIFTEDDHDSGQHLPACRLLAYGTSCIPRQLLLAAGAFSLQRALLPPAGPCRIVGGAVCHLTLTAARPSERYAAWGEL